MNQYETMILLDNREVKKGWDALKSDVCGLFTKHDAKIVSARRWDERRLAYPIKGQLRATYLLVYHTAPAESITPMNRDLQYAEQVLRHMTVVCEDIPEEAHEPEAAFDPNEIPDDDAPDPIEVEEPAESEKSEGKKAEGDDAEGEKAEGEKAEGEKAEGDAPAGDEKAAADSAAAEDKPEGGTES